MTYTEQAIKIAIENKWKPVEHIRVIYYQNSVEFVTHENNSGYNSVSLTFPEVFLAPDFWQALGKGLGWIDKDYPNGEMRCENKLGRCDTRYCPYGGYKDPKEEWHRFIDHLAFDKDIESYFKNLLEK